MIVDANANATLRRPLPFALLLVLIAGMLDAIGVVQLNGLFVSFMSGNSTHLGMSIAKADWTHAAAAVAVIGAFVSGAFAGAFVAAAASPNHRTRIVLGCELALMTAALALALAGFDHAALGLVAMAMGWQNALHQNIAGAEIGRSFVTGALFGLGQALALALRREASFVPAALYAAAWTVFVLGAVVGSLIIFSAGLVPALTMVTLAMGALTLSVLSGRL